jgi:bleomycin hydrolase
MNALKHNPVELVVRTLPTNVEFDFNVELPESVPTPSQGKTGRCWLFAGLTMLRYITKRPDLEFSYAYLYYWDKVERYRATLKTLSNVVDADIHRMVIFKDAMSDGGQWDLFAALVNKYGLMPRGSYPETFHSSNSRSMIRLVNHMLRVHEKHLRNADPKIMELMVEEAQHIYGLLLGVPPKMFDVEDAPSNATKVLKELNVDLSQFISLVHDPRRSEDADPERYELECVIDCNGKRVGWVSVSLQRLEKMATKALENGDAVWFGANVDDLEKDMGVHDPGLNDYTTLFSTFLLSKKERLETHAGVPGHAMVLTGVHMHQKMPVRWKVDNSWGTAAGPYM